MPNVAYFKRIFSIASTILTVINIWTIDEFSSKDLTLVMFIASNLLIIFRIEFASNYNTRLMQNFRKFCSGFLIIFMFILIFDEGKSFNVFSPIIIVNSVYTGVACFTCFYCIFLSSRLTTHDELNKSLATSIDTTFNIINKEAIKLRDDIEENGGWTEFLKTDIGRQFAQAVKIYTQSQKLLETTIKGNGDD